MQPPGLEEEEERTRPRLPPPCSIATPQTLASHVASPSRRQPGGFSRCRLRPPQTRGSLEEGGDGFLGGEGGQVCSEPCGRFMPLAGGLRPAPCSPSACRTSPCKPRAPLVAIPLQPGFISSFVLSALDTAVPRGAGGGGGWKKKTTNPEQTPPPRFSPFCLPLQMFPAPHVLLSDPGRWMCFTNPVRPCHPPS